MKEKELSPKQARAINLLLQNHSIIEVAGLVGVSRSTIYNWMRDPMFRGELTKAQEAIIQEAITLLSAHSAQAAQTLIQISESEIVPASIRVQALKMILFDSIRIRQSANLFERLEALEELVEEKGFR